MDFTSLTIDLIKMLSNLAGGSFGMGIIFLTILVRMAMWNLSVSQQKSMREMQRLQPEMKRIQERYKSNPQMMQQKMMEFYKKHDFNPAGGCLPMLIQMPIFILLYSALISPQFISLAGNSQFLFIKRLDATFRGSTGVSFNGDFQVGRKDIFKIDKNRVNLILLNGEEMQNVKVNSNKALILMGDIEPGQNIDFKINLDNLDMKFSQLEKVKGATVNISNSSTREMETVNFEREDNILKASVPTTAASTQYNWDVILLVALFGLSMFGAQKLMTSAQKGQKLDPQQESMQKMMGFTMPIFLTATFVFIPIPAGVLLYLVVSNIFQVAQTYIINKQLEMAEATAKNVSDDDISDAKKVEAKDIKTVDNKDN